MHFCMTDLLMTRHVVRFLNRSELIVVVKGHLIKNYCQSLIFKCIKMAAYDGNASYDINHSFI